jgi:hypothetical protein
MRFTRHPSYHKYGFRRPLSIRHAVESSCRYAFVQWYPSAPVTDHDRTISTPGQQPADRTARPTPGTSEVHYRHTLGPVESAHLRLEPCRHEPASSSHKRAPQ